jgi:NADPH-dependent 7-cyano-7-deazaguanine reductase QueF-like protein
MSHQKREVQKNNYLNSFYKYNFCRNDKLTLSIQHDLIDSANQEQRDIICV